MLFNSLKYGIFLVAVILTYFSVPPRFRQGVLLAASYYFYMSWNPGLVVLIAFTTLASFQSASEIGRRSDAKTRKRILVLGVSVCLLSLFFFKYFNFLSLTATSLLRALSLPVGDFTLDVILPVGISFYTFQTLSYIVDVYRGDMEAEQNLVSYALYVSFFPQLVAGPIERAPRLLPQLKKTREFELSRALSGARYICFGLFKKIVVADMLAETVNKVYNDVGLFGAVPTAVATFFFAFQIYCDFSGYSDIAVGSARIFGIDLMTNFDSPYLSRSIREFWRRWHISLSKWFSDYVYIPLGGNRVGGGRHVFNILVVFLLSGLWHGAAWTFVLWGLYHGVLNVLSSYISPRLDNLSSSLSGAFSKRALAALRVLVTFSLVCLGWVVFRSNSLPELTQALKNLCSGWAFDLSSLTADFKAMELTRTALAWDLIAIAAVAAFDALGLKEPLPDAVEKRGFAVRAAVTYALAFAVLLRLFTAPSITAADFIYFQF